MITSVLKLLDPLSPLSSVFPSGIYGRRAARLLTWTAHLACGWIQTGPCTFPRRGRATSEHTPAGWPQWVATIPAAPTSESGLHNFPVSAPLSSLAVCTSSLPCPPSYLHLTRQDMMDGCFPHCFDLSRFSSTICQTCLIFTVPGPQCAWLILLFAASVVWFNLPLSLCPSLTRTYVRAGNYPMLQKTQYQFWVWQRRGPSTSHGPRPLMETALLSATSWKSQKTVSAFHFSISSAPTSLSAGHWWERPRYIFC